MDVWSEQIRYVHCTICNVVLAVSVPCSRLCEVVTVRCGHCSNLWAVNMAAFHRSSAADLQAPNYSSSSGSSSITNKPDRAMNRESSSGEEAASSICLQPVHKGSEKHQMRRAVV